MIALSALDAQTRWELDLPDWLDVSAGTEPIKVFGNVSVKLADFTDSNAARSFHQACMALSLIHI